MGQTRLHYPFSQTDMFHLGATHMGLMHNAILRGYNSVYQQAKHVRDESINGRTKKFYCISDRILEGSGA